MFLLRIFQRLMRLPAIIIGMVVMMLTVVTYPLWFVLFGADFNDVVEGGGSIWNLLMDLTNPKYDWNYVPPPPDNLGW